MPKKPAVFPDTKEGVKKFMLDKDQVNQTWVKKTYGENLADAVIHADPQVEGVWAVDNKATRARSIVYLAGYKDPWGQVRELNDFEEGTF